MGLQKKASYYAIASYWIIAIPMAAILGVWQELGVMGLQTGLAIAVVF